MLNNNRNRAERECGGSLIAVDGGGIEGLACTDLVVRCVRQEASRHVEDGLQAGEGVLHAVRSQQ